MPILPDPSPCVNPKQKAFEAEVGRRLWEKVIDFFPDFARRQDLQKEGFPLPELPIDLQRQILGSLCGPHFSRAIFLVIESMIEVKIRNVISEVLRDEGVIH